MTIKITQADIDAAARFEELEWSGDHAAWTATVIQEFARHRIEAEAKERERIVTWLREMFLGNPVTNLAADEINRTFLSGENRRAGHDD